MMLLASSCVKFLRSTGCEAAMDVQVALGLYKRYGFREIHPNFDKLTMPRPSAGGAAFSVPLPFLFVLNSFRCDV